MAEAGYSLRDLIAAAAQAEACPLNEARVRQLIADGLLPPAQRRGTTVVYSEEHLLRLRLCLRLAAQYVPPKEMRQCLDTVPVPGLRALLERAPVARLPSEGDAHAYLSRLVRSLPPNLLRPVTAQFPVLQPAARPRRTGSPGREPSAQSAQLDVTNPERSHWLRVTVDSDVELLVRLQPSGGRQLQVDTLVEALRRALAAGHEARG